MTNAKRARGQPDPRARAIQGTSSRCEDKKRGKLEAPGGGGSTTPHKGSLMKNNTRCRPSPATEALYGR